MSYSKPPSRSGALNRAMVDAINAFIAAPKAIVGADEPPTWVIARQQENELTARLPLLVAGEISEPKLICVAFPNDPVLKFRILITFEPAICRLDYDHGIHANNQALYFSDLPALCRGPHYHSWEDNQQFFTTSSRAIELHNARELNPNIRTFESALRWFCEKNNIGLPNGHRIELPPRTELF